MWNTLLYKYVSDISLTFYVFQTQPDFDLEIQEDVREECSKFVPVKHIYVDKYVGCCSKIDVP